MEIVLDFDLELVEEINSINEVVFTPEMV